MIVQVKYRPSWYNIFRNQCFKVFKVGEKLTSHVNDFHFLIDSDSDSEPLNQRATKNQVL